MRNGLRALILPLPLFFACAVQSDSSESAQGDAGQEERGSLGKADLVGSCENHGRDFCGGRGRGNCWCDESCLDYGDCCADAADVCGIEPEAPEGQFCGGIAGIQCPAGQMCVNDPTDKCDPALGGADCGGVCVPAPEEKTTCEYLQEDLYAALAEVRACEVDTDCGQVMPGTSCGCTRNIVARVDADISSYYEILDKADANECVFDPMISVCDCPAVDGFVCTDNVCNWNYI